MYIYFIPPSTHRGCTNVLHKRILSLLNIKPILNGIHDEFGTTVIMSD